MFSARNTENNQTVGPQPPLNDTPQIYLENHSLPPRRAVVDGQTSNTIEQIPGLQAGWRIRSHRPGPDVALLGGLHGNEGAGLAVTTQMLSQFRHSELQLNRGSLLIIPGNIPAICAGTRTRNGVDMNRLFGAGTTRADGVFYEQRRADQIERVLSKVHFVVDLHTTTRPTTPFIATHRNNVRFAALSGIGLVLAIDPELPACRPFSSAAIIALARDYHIPAIALEAGSHHDEASKRITHETVRRILAQEEIALLSSSLPSEAPPSQEVWIPLQIYLKNLGSEFVYRKAFNNFDRLPPGAVIGKEVGYKGERVVSVSKQLAEPIAIIFATSSESIQPGQDLFTLVGPETYRPLVARGAPLVEFS